MEVFAVGTAGVGGPADAAVSGPLGIAGVAGGDGVGEPLRRTNPQTFPVEGLR